MILSSQEVTMKKERSQCKCDKLSAKCQCAPHVEGVCVCSIEGVLDVVSKKWALLTIMIIANFGTLRYNELERKMSGISPKTLSDCLKELEAANLIKREVFAEIPPKVEYTLTQKGWELREVLGPFITWASSQSSERLYEIR